MAYNLYRAYINAWSDYKENKFMEMLEEYMEPILRNTMWEEWDDIKYFHENYSIHDGRYYDVEEDYAIGNNSGKVVWKGDYPSEKIIKEIINKEED